VGKIFLRLFGRDDENLPAPSTAAFLSGPGFAQWQDGPAAVAREKSRGGERHRHGKARQKGKTASDAILPEMRQKVEDFRSRDPFVFVTI
jgi:hypothetical protein